MGRYDAYDVNSGYGVSYSKGQNSIVDGEVRSSSKSNKQKSSSSKKKETSKKKKSNGGFFSRGRSQSRSSSNPRGRSKSRSDRSLTSRASSKGSTRSKSSRSQLNVRSASRGRRSGGSSKAGSSGASKSSGAGSKASKASNQSRGQLSRKESGSTRQVTNVRGGGGGGRSGYESAEERERRDDRQRSSSNYRSRSASQQRKSDDRGRRYDLEDEVYSQWSTSVDEATAFTSEDRYNSPGERYRRAGDYDYSLHDEDEGSARTDEESYTYDGTFRTAQQGEGEEHTLDETLKTVKGVVNQRYIEEGGSLDEGDEPTKFTKVTIEPFLPDQTNIEESNDIIAKDGEDSKASEESASVGQCLFSDFKSLPQWNWKFTLNQFLSGFTVMLNQVPECVSYAYMAHIDPFHALQATWISNVLAPIVGGRPGMISGPSGLGAIALRFVVDNYGPEYIFYSVVLSGFCQVLFGGLRIGKYLRLLPPGITIGMVNALCALMILLQLRYYKAMPGIEATYTRVTEGDLSNVDTPSTVDEPTRRLESTTITEDGLNQPWAYFMGWDVPWTESTSQFIIVSSEVVVALMLSVFLPRYVPIVPAGLVTILVVTCVNMALREWSDWVAPTVGDYCISEIPTTRYWKGIFHSSYTLPPLFEWNTMAAIIPAGLSLFAINLLETMVAINVADKYTATDSEQDRVFYGQGVSNLASGLMAGMSGTGLSHSSLYNMRSGGVTSFSAFFSGIFMLCVLIFMYPAVAQIPLGAVMGITLHLLWNMIQWAPILGFFLKFAPTKCLLATKPNLMMRRLATPDVFSTVATSIFALCASTYGFAGYLIGVLCYACDPIGHAIISGGVYGYNYIGLNLPTAPVAEKIKMPKIFRGTKSSNKSGAASEETDEESQAMTKEENTLVKSMKSKSAKGDEDFCENQCDFDKVC